MAPGPRSGSRSRRGSWRRREASAAAPRRSHPRRLRRQRHPGPCRLLLEFGGDFVKHGQHGLGAKRDDTRPGLELGEEEHLVDQLDDLVDLAPCLLEERRARPRPERGELEQREEPGERRPELVRDRGRETRSAAPRTRRDRRPRRGRRAVPSGLRPGSGRRAAPPAVEQQVTGSRSPSRTPSSDWRARAARNEHDVRLRRGRRPPRDSPRPAPGPVARRVPCSGSNRSPRRCFHHLLPSFTPFAPAVRSFHDWIPDAEGSDHRGRRCHRPGDGAPPDRGRLRRRRRRERRDRPRPASLRAARRLRARPDAPRHRRLARDRAGAQRGDRHADRRRQCARHRARQDATRSSWAPTTTSSSRSR